MNRNPGKVAALFALASILAVGHAVFPSTASAAEVKIHNKNDFDMTLSDLIVYGKNNKAEIILSRHFAIDDVVIKAGQTQSFTTSFEVKAIATSTLKNGKETDYVIKQLDPNGKFAPVAWIENAADGSDLFPLIDADLAVDPPGEDSVVNFVTGLNAGLPGWFVGTNLDLDSGDVTNGFTGSARIVLSHVETATVGEPDSLALLFISAAALCLLRKGTR